MENTGGRVRLSRKAGDLSFGHVVEQIGIEIFSGHLIIKVLWL